MDIFTAVDDYIGSLFAPEDDALNAALRDMQEAGLPAINVSPVLGKFLYILAKLARARRILEIGTLGGYSAIWLARALPEDGRMITLERDPLHAKIARRNLARAMLLGRVEVCEGDALDLLQNFVARGEEPFDLIFIDADKENYANYFRLSLKLSRPGTLIAADNVIRSGAVLDAAAAASDPQVAGVLRFAEIISKDPKVDATEIQWVGTKGHDGVALCIVRQSASHI
jgi:predicted O-methyltransferase YrrM